MNGCVADGGAGLFSFGNIIISAGFSHREMCNVREGGENGDALESMSKVKYLRSQGKGKGK